MNQELPIVIREATEEDAPFIFNSWLKSFRNGALSKGVDNTVYFTEHHKVIERLLKSGKTALAVSAEDPNDIYGFANYGEVEGVFCTHYIYVKHTFRRLGVARELMRHMGHDFKNQGSLCSHQTPASYRLETRFSMIYHPYLLLNYSK